MQYRYLGQTGVKVSQLCYGTMSFGGDADESASRALYQRCREAGINFFDCANIYNGGKAEEILSRLIQKEREQIVLTSKVYFPAGADVNARGATRKHIRHAIEGSLRRLQTDYLDVYFVHHFDDQTALEETLSALDDLVHQGKVLYLGASNFAAWQVAKALGISALHQWARFEVLQPMYNLLKRQAEVELLPMALSEKLAVIPYSPLAGGILTGKYSQGQKPAQGRLLTNKMYQTRYSDELAQAAADSFVAYAHERGYDPTALAVAWVESHPAITAPIIGARSVQQLEGSLRSVDIELTPAERAEISALTPEPAVATDRSEERSEASMNQR